MTTLPQIDTVPHRLILFASNGTEVLVRNEGGRLALPTVPIPRHRRVAETLTDFIKQEWAQDAVSLFALNPESAECHACYEVAESVATPPTIQGFRWVSVNSNKTHQFESGDCAAITDALTRCTDYATGRRQGPFGKLGWFAELTDWVRYKAGVAGLTLLGRFTQFNASSRFSLIRFETNGPALWFKAVGEPNQREYPITRYLTDFVPEYLPRLIASEERWNAWLSLEAEGEQPNAASTLEQWILIVQKLGKLQIASLGRLLHILGLGARDARTFVLREEIAPFAERATDLMARQPASKTKPLSREELLRLADELKFSLDAVDAAGLPNVLGHLDFNSTNVLVSENRCVFLDWAEACVGPPLLTLASVLESFEHVAPQYARDRGRLISAFHDTWATFHSGRMTVLVPEVISLAGLFARLVGSSSWTELDQIHSPVVMAILRTRIRKMKQLADQQSGRRLSCLS